MTQKEAQEAVKRYIRINNVDAEQLVFSAQEAVAKGRQIMLIDYENNHFELFTDEGDHICTIAKDFMIEIFPQIEPLVYCQECNGSEITFYNHAGGDPEDLHEGKCEHEDVIYK